MTEPVREKLFQSDAQALVARLETAYPLMELTAETREIFVRFLTGLDAEVTAKVVDDVIATSTRFPTIADIRRRVFEITLELPTPIDAWTSVVSGGKIHPLTRKVRDFFGGEWGIKTSETPSITRTQFLRLYEELRDEALRTGNAKRFAEWAQSPAVSEQQAPAPDPILVAEERARAAFALLPEAERRERVAALADWQPRAVVPPDVLPAIREYEATMRYGIEQGLVDAADEEAA